MDLPRIASHLAKVMDTRGDFQLVSLSEDDVGIVIILCGCPRACGNKEEVRARAKQNMVIAGESLNGTAIPEISLPSAVEQELIKILDS